MSLSKRWFQISVAIMALSTEPIVHQAIDMFELIVRACPFV